MVLDRLRAPEGVRYVRRRVDVLAIGVGLVILGIGMVLVRNGTVSGFEEGIFRAINDLPQFLYPEVWPLNQLGALAAGPVVMIIAAITRRWRLAAAALSVTVLKLVLERAVKAVVYRGRPGRSIGLDIHMRGDVTASGASFTSGHAILIAALATIVVPYLAGRWRLVPWVVIGSVMFARVYVGAHNPLDVVCGAALGVAIGSLGNLVFGVPAPAIAQPD